MLRFNFLKNVGTSPCRNHDPVFVLTFLTIFSVIILYPLLVIVWLVLTIHAKLAVLLAKRGDSLLRERLTGLDAIFAGKYSSEKLPQCVVCIYIPLLVPVTYSGVLEALREKIPFPFGRFPTLTQTITQKYSYLFWKHVDKFQMEDHVHRLKGMGPGGTMSRAELRHLCMNQLQHDSFPKNQSPWECRVVEKLVDDEDTTVKSAIVFRYHHCLMDGHSLMKFLEALSVNSIWRGLGGKRRETRESSDGTGISLWILQGAWRLWSFGVLVFTGPYHVWKMFLFSKDDTFQYHRNNDSGHNPRHGDNVGRVWYSHETSIVPVQKLKEIKDKTGSNLSSVIFTVATEVVNQTWQRNGGAMPEKMHCVFPYPMTRVVSRDSLSNNFIALKLPIHSSSLSTGNDDSLLTTLRDIDYTFENLRRSAVPKIMEIITRLIGSLPVSIIPGYDELTPCIFTVSNFPGPVTVNQQLDLLGYAYKEIGFSVTPPDNMQFFVGCVSVNGQMRFHVAARKNAIFQRECDAPLLTKTVMYTLDRLERESG